MKVFGFLVGVLITFMSVIGVIGSLIAMKLSGITLIVLLILQLTGVISIGWMVLGYPAMMLFGGLFLLGFSMLVTAISVMYLGEVAK